MADFKKNSVSFVILSTFSLILLLGALSGDFKTLNLVFINLIFISLVFNNKKITLYSGIGVSLLFSLLPLVFKDKNLINNDQLIYWGTLFLIFISTIVSLFILDLNYNIKQSLKHFFLLYEYSTEGIIISDERGRIIMANPTACGMFGYNENELKNQPVEILIPSNHKNLHPKMRMDYVKKPSNRQMGAGRDLSGIKKNSSIFPVEISLSTYTDQNKTFVIAFIVDITVRKNSEKIIIQKNESLEQMAAELAKLNEELEVKVNERTNNLQQVMKTLEKSELELKDALAKEKEMSEIKSSFVSMASHEFRTPLSTILSSANIMQRYEYTDEQDKRNIHIKKIKESVRYLNEILEDFLSFGKLEQSKINVQYSDESLNEIINSAIDELEILKKPAQHIEFYFEGSDRIETDKNLLKNICINLLTNAIKFSMPDGKIIINCINRPQMLKIEIKDFGIGIPEEDKTHLFTTFFRSKNAVNIQGTGLGLHIVKRHLNLLNGEIYIDSKLNEGTIVTFIIPKNTNEQ
ncbi:MAG: PAS domain S-box protein [Bacteroidia bacterium]|nr:PAS domain S-box protein [Bacteroidia bacterium]